MYYIFKNILDSFWSILRFAWGFHKAIKEHSMNTVIVKTKTPTDLSITVNYGKM